MAFDSSLKRPVLAGIISGLIVVVLSLIFIQPLFRLCGNLMRYLGGNVYLWFIDRIYNYASAGDTSEIVNMLFSFFSSFLNGFVFFSFFLTFQLWPTKKPREVKPINQRIIAITLTFKKVVLLTMLILAIFAAAMTYIYSYKMDAVLKLNIVFRMRVTMLAPFLTEQEEEELMAKWAYMRNKADYEEINKIVDNYADKNNVKLPKPPYY